MSEHKYKFDEPIKTKSGRDVVELWNELQEEIRKNKKWTYLEPNKELRLVTAKQIRHLQDDLGLTLTQFPELTNSDLK